MNLTPATVAAPKPPAPVDTVTFRQNCPACGVEVEWRGTKKDANGTVYRFIGGCGDCPDSDDEGESAA